MWKSWNVIEDNIIKDNVNFINNISGGEQATSFEPEPEDQFDELASVSIPLVVQTPIGVFPQDSFFLPSNRWDCWLGHTNFDITHNLQNKIEEVAGVENLKTIGRYTFFVGVAPLFKMASVRREIEKVACVYTENEILSDSNIKIAVEEVKNQIADKSYWSIFVGIDGNIDYCISDAMDIGYLRDVNKLVTKKESLGGILLRSENG
tara:strand:+ start:1606 stop:2223 length:618 start_codon:yes stop_codon:yes gene_type:complete